MVLTISLNYFHINLVSHSKKLMSLQYCTIIRSTHQIFLVQVIISNWPFMVLIISFSYFHINPFTSVHLIQGVHTSFLNKYFHWEMTLRSKKSNFTKICTIYLKQENYHFQYLKSEKHLFLTLYTIFLSVELLKTWMDTQDHHAFI